MPKQNIQRMYLFIHYVSVCVCVCGLIGWVLWHIFLLITFLNKSEVFFFFLFLHAVKWFQAFLSHTDNSIYY